MCLTGYGNDVYLFWSDERNNDISLYFKKGIYTKIEEERNIINKEANILSSNILFLPQRIKFFVKYGEKYSLNLFNLNGRKLLNLKEGKSKGIEEVILEKVNPGNYFLILETRERKLKKKILILKGCRKS